MPPLTQTGLRDHFENEDLYYKNNFNELDKLGETDYATVFKVKNFKEETFAVKKINLEILNTTNRNLSWEDVDYLKKVQNQFIVSCYKLWIEQNTIYIQMEILSDNLHKIIQAKRSLFERSSPSIPMSDLEYYISTEIFREVLECVNTLHESIPPIIHRDLKPANILVSYSSINGRFLKICDLGLATFHETESMSHTQNVGTPQYTAPEVKFSRKYNSSADIYSLGIIAQELFDYDINDESPINYASVKLGEKFENLQNIIISMTCNIMRLRPTCATLLKSYNDWSLDKQYLQNSETFATLEKFKKKDTKEINFFLNFLNAKLGKFDVYPDYLKMTNVEESLHQLAEELEELFAKTRTFTLHGNYCEKIELGRDIFNEFYDAGYELQKEKGNLKLIDLTKSADVNIVGKLIKSHYKYLCWFIYAYPSEIEFDFDSPAFDICLIRSGIQFMFDIFDNIDPELNSILAMIKDKGDLEELNKRLLIWRDNYSDIKSCEIPTGLPEEHWWWFDEDYIKQ